VLKLFKNYAPGINFLVYNKKYRVLEKYGYINENSKSQGNSIVKLEKIYLETVAEFYEQQGK